MLAAFFSENFVQVKYYQTREGKLKMKIKKKCHWGIKGLLLCAGILFLNGNGIKAEASGGNSLDYGVNPIMQGNQREETQAYFDLKMAPGEEQTLAIEVVNYSEEDKTIAVSVATASTNFNGTTEYSVNPNVEADDSLLYKMEDLVSTEGRIVVPAGGTYTVDVKVLMPSVSFDGILAGGINFQEIVDEADEEVEEESGVTIINEYSYVIALLMRVNDTEVVPNLQLNEVSAAQNNWRNVISANLQNFQPAYVTEMSVDAKVKRKGEEETLYALSKEMMEMAPNSNFNYFIPLNGEPFEAGTYILTMEVTSAEDSWNFEREFVITADEAKAFNETDVSIERSKLWIYVVAGAGILLIVLLIFFLVLHRKRKKNQKMRLKEIITEIISRIKGNG